MRIGTEDRKKLKLAGVAGFFGIIAIGVIYYELFGGTSAPPPAAAPVVVTVPTIKNATPSKTVSAPPGFVVGQANGVPGAAAKVGSSGAALDPTLHMEPMLATESLVYTGSGRNIFGIGPAAAPVATQIAIVKPLGSARPVQTVYTPPAPTGPPPPPPINLKFFGTATAANGTRKAFLLNGDDVFLAAAGDVVQRRYRVVSIALNSIQIEDIPNSNKQTLPLVGN